MEILELAKFVSEASEMSTWVTQVLEPSMLAIDVKSKDKAEQDVVSTYHICPENDEEAQISRTSDFVNLDLMANIFVIIQSSVYNE